MEFHNEERIYFNRIMYEERKLHLQLSKELFLQYFITLMRDYGIDSQYTSINYSIKESRPRFKFIIFRY
jgi:hypothetical protein